MIVDIFDEVSKNALLDLFLLRLRLRLFRPSLLVTILGRSGRFSGLGLALAVRLGGLRLAFGPLR